jgi:hypothetical protein
VQGFTLLDTGSHRAVTASVGAFYANLAPSSSRFADSSVLVAPTTLQEYGGVEQAASIIYDEGARLGSDFIPSRSYIEWTFLSVAPTRARVVVKEHGKEAQVQNALGGEVEFFAARLHSGEYAVLSSLQDGESREAKVQRSYPLPDLGALAKRLSTAASAQLTAGLRDGEFIAVLRGPGFTPLGGLSLEHTDSRHIVRGGFER